MILTYKYRIKDRSARKTLRRHAYAINQVWNYCVNHQREVQARYRSGAPPRRWPSKFDLAHLTAGSSKELGIHSQSIGEVCHQFVLSRDTWGRAPRFRASSGSGRSLGWIPFRDRSRQVVGNCVSYLGKRFRFWEGGRPVPAAAKGGCFVEDARGRWYVCFQVECSDGLPCGTGIIGIDLGLRSLAACSNGELISAQRHYRQHEKKLATAQRAGNQGRVKAIHAEIANARRDYLHKATTKIAQENKFIVVGDVRPTEIVGRGMAKSVLDASWSAFRNLLRYKASRHGAIYVEADERMTSQLCSGCGAPSGPKGIAQLGIRHWECGDCGAVHDRDVNAAVNILNVALSAQRLAEESRGLVSTG
jgi:IS605 OrfB family transposase